MSDRIPNTVDVCVPTWNSEPVITETLQRLAASCSAANVNLGTLIVVDNESGDKTIASIRSVADAHDWSTNITIRETTLPEAREMAIQDVETDWFLFLDDDVRISENYIQKQIDCIAPFIGAVQGRKRSNTEDPGAWVRRRVNRGGTHATLIRTQVVRDIRFPKDLVVLEDEYLRRYVQKNGYLWLFNHRARFEHQSMERHGIDWQQGYLAGKYGLIPFYVILLAIGEALITRKRLAPRIVRMAGWIIGCATNWGQDPSDSR